jgi:hypothetical protein
MGLALTVVTRRRGSPTKINGVNGWVGVGLDLE